MRRCFAYFGGLRYTSYIARLSNVTELCRISILVAQPFTVGLILLTFAGREASLFERGHFFLRHGCRRADGLHVLAQLLDAVDAADDGGDGQGEDVAQGFGHGHYTIADRAGIA